MRDYCLGDASEKSRSRRKFFAALGFSAEEWQVLRDALMRQVMAAEVSEARVDEYGTTYRATGPISTPVGKNPVIDTFWIIRKDDPRPQFTSALPRA